MYSIRLDGFKTRQQAEAFVSWYEGQGEQDAIGWFGNMKEKGELDVTFMPVDMDKYSHEWDGDVLPVTLDMLK